MGHQLWEEEREDDEERREEEGVAMLPGVPS